MKRYRPIKARWPDIFNHLDLALEPRLLSAFSNTLSAPCATAKMKTGLLFKGPMLSANDCYFLRGIDVINL